MKTRYIRYVLVLSAFPLQTQCDNLYAIQQQLYSIHTHIAQLQQNIQPTKRKKPGRVEQIKRAYEAQQSQRQVHKDTFKDVFKEIYHHKTGRKPSDAIVDTALERAMPTIEERFSEYTPVYEDNIQPIARNVFQQMQQEKEAQKQAEMKLKEVFLKVFNNIYQQKEGKIPEEHIRDAAWQDARRYIEKEYPDKTLSLQEFSSQEIEKTVQHAYKEFQRRAKPFWQQLLQMRTFFTGEDDDESEEEEDYESD